jgi:hypothetical protein
MKEYKRLLSEGSPTVALKAFPAYLTSDPTFPASTSLTYAPEMAPIRTSLWYVSILGVGFPMPLGIYLVS